MPDHHALRLQFGHFAYRNGATLCRDNAMQSTPSAILESTRGFSVIDLCTTVPFRFIVEGLINVSTQAPALLSVTANFYFIKNLYFGECQKRWINKTDKKNCSRSVLFNISERYSKYRMAKV